PTGRAGEGAGRPGGRHRPHPAAAGRTPPGRGCDQDRPPRRRRGRGNAGAGTAARPAGPPPGPGDGTAGGPPGRPPKGGPRAGTERGSLAETMAADRAALGAELELCGTAAERVAVLERAVVSERKLEELVATRVREGRVPSVQALQAKAGRLEVEIALEKAK